MGERVVCTLQDGVADVRLNRPDKMNALDEAMFDALLEVGDELARDRRVRAVVLSGEGRAFCTGLDFAGFQSMAGSGMSGLGNIGATEGRSTHRAQQAVWVWHEMPAPVIAAVHGVALGGGCQLAVGADLRFCTADAQFSVLEIRWGLTPDMTITAVLPRLVGLDVAKDLTFTGRMVSGEEAVRIGLATRVCADPRGDALAYAADLAGRSPEAVQGAKRLFNTSGAVPVAEQFRLERETIGGLIGGANQVEAVTAFFEKRPPVFADPS